MTDKKAPSPDGKRSKKTLTYEEWANKYTENKHKDIWKRHLISMKIDYQ